MGTTNSKAERVTSDQATLLLAVIDRLASLSSLDDQLAALVEIITKAIGADRSSIFLHDDLTGELYGRVTQGNLISEIRVPDTVGIIGHVFTSGQNLLTIDPYSEPHFNPSVDELTGYKTKSILCVPVRTRRGDVLGVAQSLNKKVGRFTKSDLAILEAILQKASIVLNSSLFAVKMLDNQRKEAEFLNVVSEISSEIQLGPLLKMIIQMVTRMLNAERSTLFLHDEKTGELYTEVAEGVTAGRIRFPNDRGIAGAVFQTGETINIPYAYADLRFNPAFDKRNNFFTRSLLCVPVSNKAGKVIGVTQVLNKIGGAFNKDDEVRLKAFTAQISIALENAQLFEDIQNIKNYNESVLESMSNGVVTFDAAGKIVTCNEAGLRILGVKQEAIFGKTAEEFFTGDNAWVAQSVRKVEKDRVPAITMDAEFAVGNERRSVNVSTLPLTSNKGGTLGSMALIEDVSNEKRMKATMSRYMDPGLANQLLQAGEEILGGQTKEATVLFADVRSFTTLTEQLGAHGTVALLNEYFTLMVECIQKQGGMLDKFIGDAMMAVFGTPLAHDDDADRAVRAAMAMMRELGAFNQRRAASGLKPIDIGIGLCTDHVVVGNIGSPKRMDYTVIGDGVNLAARLESACKQYGVHILISQSTLDHLRGTYRTREIDAVVVKGKNEPVRVHEVLDYHTEQSFPRMIEVVQHFRDGIELYRARNWESAALEFEQGLRIHPSDKPSRLYAERCKHYRENPPPADWKGVWVMEEK
ncbi:MAG: GAF domain-containing protein [Planctomycetes bacterium]|nr:GAF domain-containing protein [Planctomycetota bacterium]